MQLQIPDNQNTKKYIKIIATSKTHENSKNSWRNLDKYKNGWTSLEACLTCLTPNHHYAEARTNSPTAA
jgi:hypothetical protein